MHRDRYRWAGAKDRSSRLSECKVIQVQGSSGPLEILSTKNQQEKENEPAPREPSFCLNLNKPLTRWQRTLEMVSNSFTPELRPQPGSSVSLRSKSYSSLHFSCPVIAAGARTPSTCPRHRETPVTLHRLDDIRIYTYLSSNSFPVPYS